MIGTEKFQCLQNWFSTREHKCAKREKSQFRWNNNLWGMAWRSIRKVNQFLWKLLSLKLQVQCKHFRQYIFGNHNKSIELHDTSGICIISNGWIRIGNFVNGICWTAPGNYIVITSPAHLKSTANSKTRVADIVTSVSCTMKMELRPDFELWF